MSNRSYIVHFLANDDKTRVSIALATTGPVAPRKISSLITHTKRLLDEIARSVAPTGPRPVWRIDRIETVEEATNGQAPTP